MKRPLAYITAAWCGDPDTDMELAARYCRMAYEDTFMDELNPTVREQEIYEEMELTPEIVKSIRTLCGTCLRHFVDAKAFKIALVPSPDRSMDTCTVCQMRRGYDYVVMHR